MKVQLTITDIHQAFAGQILHARIDPLPIQKVLGEMIRLADGTGMIEKANKLHEHMEKKFGVKHSNYRAVIGQLIEMTLIRRENNQFILCHDLRHKFDTFEVVQHNIGMTK